MIPSYVSDDQVFHIVPQNDLREHKCNRLECWCNPILANQDEGGYIIVHNSMDGREKFETGERKLS